MGRRVRTRDRLAPLHVDRPQHRAANRELAGDDATAVHDEIAERLLRVVDLYDGTVSERDPAMIGELPARLGVERSPVEGDLDVGAGGRGVDGAALDEKTTQRRLDLDLGVAGEGRRATALQQRAVEAHIDVAGLALRGIALRPQPLLAH